MKKKYISVTKLKLEKLFGKGNIQTVGLDTTTEKRNAVKKRPQPSYSYKLDDVSWHQMSDHLTGLEGVHIALMLCALVEKDAYKREEIVRTVSECSMTPLEQLSILSDNKLFSNDFKQPYRQWLEKHYDSLYLPSLEDGTLHLSRSPRASAPYNISDSWENVNVVKKFITRHLNTDAS
ncbi:hypothetical protein IPM09_01915 [Candidatus Saccharibacteria bacterium]|nr:MAG: hypothetical protein IPM09_01915 [Candidatus Saccharibacteria bacterium]